MGAMISKADIINSISVQMTHKLVSTFLKRNAFSSCTKIVLKMFKSGYSLARSKCFIPFPSYVKARVMFYTSKGPKDRSTTRLMKLSWH